MKSGKFKIFFTLLICIFSSLLSAEENEKQERLAFTIITISDSIVSKSLINEATVNIRKHLTAEKFFLINDQATLTENITFNNCLKEQCAGQLARITPEGIGLLISITSEEIKIDEKHVSRYVIEDITETRYTIHAAAVDILNKKYDLEFKETFNSTAKLLNEADMIGKKIRDHYIKRKPLIKPEMKEESRPSDIYNLTGVSLNLSYMYPSGRFTDITDYGYGMETVLSGISPLIPFVTINPGISVYTMAPSNGNINSAHMFLPEITFGYNYNINEQITLTPDVGTGYSLMLIDGIVPDDPGSSGSSFYYNPEFKVGLGASYFLSQDYSLLFDASYHCIAERDSKLYFASFNFGIRMNLK